MKNKIRNLTQGAIIAALYAVLTCAQNLILPGSATWAVQLRLSECMCVLAFFTPAAVWGLGVGCFLFNILFAGTLPLDWLLGTLATVLSGAGMYLSRNVRLWKVPVLGLCLPGVCNGLLVGWELSIYVGGGFWLNALYVAVGELMVLLSLGTALYFALQRPHLRKTLQ